MLFPWHLCFKHLQCGHFQECHLPGPVTAVLSPAGHWLCVNKTCEDSEAKKGLGAFVTFWGKAEKVLLPDMCHIPVQGAVLPDDNLLAVTFGFLFR